MNYKIIITFDTNGNIITAIFENVLDDTIKEVNYSINYAKTDAALHGKIVPVSLIAYNKVNMRVLTFSDGFEYEFPIATVAVLDFGTVSFQDLLLNHGKYLYNKQENKLEINPNWTEPKVTLNDNL